jgi:hypothetical protein
LLVNMNPPVFWKLISFALMAGVWLAVSGCGRHSEPPPVTTGKAEPLAPSPTPDGEAPPSTSRPTPFVPLGAAPSHSPPPPPPQDSAPADAYEQMAAEDSTAPVISPDERSRHIAAAAGRLRALENRFDQVKSKAARYEHGSAAELQMMLGNLQAKVNAARSQLVELQRASPADFEHMLAATDSELEQLDQMLDQAESFFG